MKFAVHLPVYRRPTITETAFKSLQRVLNEFNEAGIETRVLCIGHEARLKRLARKYGFEWFEYGNDFVGKKFDMGLRELMKDESWTHLLEYCSDNVMEKRYVPMMLDALLDGAEFIGVRSFYIVNSRTKQCRLFATGGMSNVGRVTERSAIEKVFRRRGYVYEHRAKKGLDACLYKAVTSIAKVTPFTLETETPLVVDLKSAESMHTFEAFAQNSQKFPVVNLTGHFEELESKTEENGDNRENS